MEALLCGLFPRPPGGDGMSIMEARRRLEIQDARIDRLREKLEDRGEQIVDMRHAVSDMMDDLENMRHGAGRLRALSNVEKATNAVLNLSDTFDSLDKNSNGNIDLAELRRGLSLLGMDSHSPQADAILKRYSLQPDSGTMDVKAFSALVRDVHLLLTFDRDGSGTLDAEELRPALKSLGLDTSDRQCEAILRAWDHDRSGKLDLLEFTELVKSLQTFSKFDRDGSGDIDIGELRPALRRLGLPSDSASARAILMWYDADESGRIELHEFATLARDISVFQSFDLDASGFLDAKELLPALTKLGLAASAEEVQQILAVWDDNADGTIDLIEFAALVRDLQIFHEFDRDSSGAISSSELRMALRKLGVNLDAREAAEMLDRYDADHSGQIELPEFRRLAEDLPSLVGRKASNFSSFKASSAGLRDGDSSTGTGGWNDPMAA